MTPNPEFKIDRCLGEGASRYAGQSRGRNNIAGGLNDGNPSGFHPPGWAWSFGWRMESAQPLPSW